ncbi:MAG TPA: OmpA family protein [Dongiaceae bacterium]|nr:OmpA family protein [Dongiaceae bacterium]
MNIRVIGAVAALGLLAGCVSNIEEVGKARGTGSAFTQALTEEYKAFVAEEHDEYDWSGADYFARKGLAAAGGQVVQPEELGNYDLGDAGSEIAAARARLVNDLNNGGRDAKPAVAAKAQVKFDCWVHEQDEGWQKDEIAACKNDLMAALDELEKKEAAAPAAPTMAPMNYTVYFDFDRSNIRPDQQAVINQVLADARAHPPSSISVTGHTDTVGTAAYNMALGLRRADAVRSALIAGGVAADKITVASRGMTDLAVPTGPNVREAKNRRAEIILQP